MRALDITYCALAALVAIVIVSFWAVLGAAQPPPAGLSVPDKIACVSYAPFRADQSPLNGGVQIPAWQIEDDLAQLAKLTPCIRTYSTELGLEQVPAIAQRHGLKVMQGIWLSRLAARNRLEVTTAVDLAKRYPETITALIVGNEVLLRGELAAADIANIMRGVKAQVPVPVTYADVWEFWLRNRDLAQVADFVTIHILPYWEDFPIPAAQAPAHVDAIHGQVAAAFPGKPIMIGEVGWPSAGRMREGALPSPSNQVRMLEDVMSRAQRNSYRVNVIEAFDQPWKRQLEGTVGGHWGLIGSQPRVPKFEWGKPVSDHPAWMWQAAGGVALAVAALAAAWRARRATSSPVRPGTWAGLAVAALAGGLFAPWAIETVPVESLGWGGWLRGLAYALVAVASPIVCAAGMAARVMPLTLTQLMGHARGRPSGLGLALGVVFAAVVVLAIQTALALVFDPRYRDFPFAALTAAATPFMLLGATGLWPAGAETMPPQYPERVAAVLLASSAIYIAVNETFLNWQALWLSAVFLGFSLALFRVRGAPG